MAHPITFKPQPVDFRKELMRRIEEAPREHAEAVLAAWDLLQTSYDEGFLELTQGLMGGKDIIAGKLAKSANLPESTNAIRNGMALARILGSIDPDMLYRLSKNMDDAWRAHVEAITPPGWWQLLRAVTSEDGRRGVSLAVGMLVALGRSAKSPENKSPANRTSANKG